MRKVLQWLKGLFWQDVRQGCLWPDLWFCSGRLLSWEFGHVVGHFVSIRVPLFALSEYFDYQWGRYTYGYRTPQIIVWLKDGGLRVCCFLRPHGEQEVVRRYYWGAEEDDEEGFLP